MTATRAQEKIKAGKSEFVLDELGYGLRRKISTGPLAGSYHTDHITERCRLALQRRGFKETERFYHSR